MRLILPRALLAALLCSLLGGSLSACGQKGPLFIPTDTPAGTPPASQPAQ